MRVYITYKRQIDVPAERQLNNEAFMAKAPTHIVDGLRKQHVETKTLYDKTKAALDELPTQ